MQDTRNTEREVLALEREFWQAIQERDGETAARLTDDPCLVAGAQGIARLDRRDLSAMLQNAPYLLQHFTLGDDAQVRMLGEDIAVVAYDVHEQLVVDGKPVSLHAADTSTWVRRGGRWVCAVHTEAVRGDPYGRDRANAKKAD